MEASAATLPPRVLRPTLRRLGGDNALVAAVRAGDEQAFESIFDRFHRPLLSFCRHMLGNREEAEDAVQQTFMGAYRSLAASDKPIQLRPWLYTIARNQCLSTLRSRHESVPLEDVAPATEGLASEVQRRDDLRQMLADMARLPDDQRAALVLAELGSLSHDEIAQVIECPREKVKALVFQARSSLTASRSARDTPCTEVRQQLATLTGGALRRTSLRRHVRECAGCRAFQTDVRRQRQAMAVLLPVAPTAGFKSSVLSALGINCTGAAAGAGTLGLTSVSAVGSGVGLSKVLALVAATVAVGGGTVALDEATPWLTVPSAEHHAAGPGAQSAARAASSRSPASPGVGSAVAELMRDTTGALGSVTPRAGQRSGNRVSGGSRSGDRTGSAKDGDTAGQAKSRDGGRGDDSRDGGRGGNSGAGSGSNRHGRSESSPGRRETAPGLAGTTPGQSGRTPAHGSPPPGRAGTSPGRSGHTPGRSKGADDQQGRRRGGHHGRD